MNTTRRQWLLGAAQLTAASILPWRLWANEPEQPFIHLAAMESTNAWFDQPTAVWQYDQPVIRLKQGVPQRIRVTNRLPVPTSVHWHGLRVANAMDGVSGLTQAPIQPGESFDYELNSPDAGTFWFHSHHNAIEQLARGLYGALIVESDREPVFERDWTLMLDDWLIGRDYSLDPDFSNLNVKAHGGRTGNFLTINHQRSPWVGEAIAGDRVRLRVVNSATNRIFELSAEMPGAVLLAKDGQPLPAPEPLPDGWRIGPGERWDIGWIARDTGRVLMPVRGRDPLEVARVEVGAGNTPSILYAPEAMTLPPNPMPVPAGTVAKTIPLEIEGGAMGRLASARFDGKTLSFQELVEHDQVWALSGQAGLGDAPLFRAARGETVELRLNNRTSFAHTLHWHGHHVWAEGKWQDSLTLERGQELTVRMVAGEPGKWLIHCHMIDHQATGMVTWFEVA